MFSLTANPPGAVLPEGKQGVAMYAGDHLFESHGLSQAGRETRMKEALQSLDFLEPENIASMADMIRWAKVMAS